MHGVAGGALARGYFATHTHTHTHTHISRRACLPRSEDLREKNRLKKQRGTTYCHTI